MEFRKATPSDVAEIMDIIAAAQNFMRSSGLPQWQDGYPAREIIEEDVEVGESYVLTDGGVILGTAVVSFRPDPSYRNLTEGAWLDDGPYAAVHRVAVRAERRKKGSGTAIFGYAEGLARAEGISSIRGDTHHLNLLMQGLLAKCGFVRCGCIILVDPAQKDNNRVVYQKLLR
ncbi:MAG: N-acetyltransferase family protein [Oscillospiraceae bacterium]